nr:MAG TPA: hypothetical protein [Caudoviricetes sp.]
MHSYLQFNYVLFISTSQSQYAEYHAFYNAPLVCLH